MQKKLTWAELDQIRGNWYAWAYAYRQAVSHLSEATQSTLYSLSQELGPCKMTRYGGPPASWPPAKAFQIARTYRIHDVECLCPWFTSADGWAEYVREFEQLHIDEDPILIHNLSKPVENLPVIHNLEEIKPEKRKKTKVIR